MKRILIAGAGQIGTTMAHLLSATGSYQVTLADQDIRRAQRQLSRMPHLELVTLDLSDEAALVQLIKSQALQGVVSCLPYFLNKPIAHAAHATQIHYFDLTEDVAIAAYVNRLAKQAHTHAFVTQCGLAPGLINIVAHELMQHFDTLDTVKLRCGGLPKTSSNELHYALTWSIDGLINEYNRPCQAIENGQATLLSPLANLEHIQIDGLAYEAFNTSGGIGSLTETYAERVSNLNYKSIRYPGHRDRMRFLMQGLKLGQQTDLLKQILLANLPSTVEDVVILYINVIGTQQGKLTQSDFVRKFYGRTLDGIAYSALQLTTACSACSVVNQVMQAENYVGHIKQEQFSLTDILHGPFGHYLQESL